MTQEEKELLLKDLCARLPYGVKVQYDNGIYNIDYISALYKEIKLDIPDNYTIGISEIKPYLRPMSSMTEEEKNELVNLCTMGNGSVNTDWESFGINIIDTHPRFGDSFYTDYCVIDWLNKNMFDFRGLIFKDRAIAITKENNPF